MAKSSRNVSIPRKRLIKEPEIVQKDISLLREAFAIILCFVSIFIFLSIYSFFSNIDKENTSSSLADISTSAEQNSETLSKSNLMGQVGFVVAQNLIDYLGYCAFSVVICVFLIAGLVMRHGSQEKQIVVSRLIMISFFCISLILSTACLCSILFGYNGGGYFGSKLAVFFEQEVNKAGTILASIASIVISLAVLVNLRLDHYFSGLKLIWKGTKTAAKDTGLVLNAGVKVGNSAIRKTTEILNKKKSNLTNGFTLGSTEEESDFILGEMEEEEEEGGRALKSKKSKRIRVVKPVKRSVKTRFSKSKEDEDEEDEEFNEDYDEDDDLSEEEEIEDAEEYVPLISRENQIASKKPKKVLKKVNSKKDLPVSKTIKYSSQYDDYQLPNRDLLVGLDGISNEGPQDDELLQNSRKLEIALRNFKLGGRVVEVHPGPIVTLYQFEPAAGIKVQRIINLADDLALALKVESVRVYAPVPGKGTVGIEVPNADREVVRLRDIVDSEDFQVKPAALPLALGKDTYGHAYVADLSKMPHLLIAGATGTGKSVCINSLLMSLLYKNSPNDLRLILIDPKMLELSIYESISHLLSPVVTNPKRARGVLYWAVEEMERRYEMMKHYGVRDVAMFNRMVGEGEDTAYFTQNNKKDAVINLEEKDVLTTTAAQAMIDRNSMPEDLTTEVKGIQPLPRIVIVVDELADLMLTVGKEIEELLTRLAQKARAAGIHLILATQRPSVNVITGLIKANFPARISFKVASRIDARTVMDQSGAERLLGQGDMLFLSPSIGRVKRLHSPFVSDQEVHDVVSWIRTQGEPDYNVDIEKTLKILEDQEAKSAGYDGPSTEASEYDPLYNEAVNLVLEKGQASTSMVQRVFRIGYNRAARILEMMEKEGVVGPADGAKPRQILIDSLHS